MPTSRSAKRVFLNIPYDTAFEPLYIAYILGIVAFDLSPVLAISEANGATRIERIYNLLHSCRYSIHDVSRIQLSKSNALPRFNMPFELGIAVALAKANPRTVWIAFDSRSGQAAKTISDLAGSDFLIHGDTPKGVLSKLCDVFAAKGEPSVPHLLRLHSDLMLTVPGLLKESGGNSIFGPRMLKDLIQAAQNSVSMQP